MRGMRRLRLALPARPAARCHPSAHRDRRTGPGLGAVAPVLVEQATAAPRWISGWQSQGGTPTVSNPAVGQWTVRLGGLTGLGGNVQLTQYLLTGEESAWCIAVRSVSRAPDATAKVVRVRC